MTYTTAKNKKSIYNRLVVSQRILAHPHCQQSMEANFDSYTCQ